MSSQVFDERSERPLRAVIGELLASADSVDLAITRVRLGALDLSEAEVRGPSRCRVLLGQLDASTLLDPPGPGAPPGPALARLAAWLGSGRLQVRSAGIGAWTPDFSVYRRHGTATSLLGAHYFGSPQLTVGPSVTVVTRDPSAARLLRRRFDELWGRGHDVAPAILDVLEHAAAGEAAGEASVGRAP